MQNTFNRPYRPGSNATCYAVTYKAICLEILFQIYDVLAEWNAWVDPLFAMKIFFLYGRLESTALWCAINQQDAKTFWSLTLETESCVNANEIMKIEWRTLYRCKSIFHSALFLFTEKVYWMCRLNCHYLSPMPCVHHNSHLLNKGKCCEFWGFIEVYTSVKLMSSTCRYS